MTRWTVIAATLMLSSTPLAAQQPPNKIQTEKIQISPEVKPAPPKAKADALEIHHGTETLPDRVRIMRNHILDAAKSGEIEALRRVLQMNELPPAFAVNDIGDPIEYLRNQSGDGEGREVLAIIWDILESGWVRVGAGTSQEMYVWPFFAETPLDGLTPEQLVEAYRVVTSSDLDEMKSTGKYLFYKIGIGPDGTWHYFKIPE